MFWRIVIVSLLLVVLAILLLMRRKPDEAHAKPARFYKLSAIDRQMADRVSPAYDRQITLSQFCDRFRDYAASRLGLYYEPKLMRLFVAGLASGRLTIMQGISGTGKTSLAYAFAKFVCNDAVMIPVQPSWRDRSDLLGYYNEFSKRFNETNLLEKMYEANYTDDVYIAVLDEMNIARVEYYFAEFLSVLEIPASSEWRINVVPDEWPSDPQRLRGGKINLPSNMWYIGTANNDDSTFAISDKVYDRAMVIDIDGKAEPFTAPSTEPVHMSAKHLTELFEQAQRQVEIPAGLWEKIAGIDRYLVEHLRVSFGNRIVQQIKKFLPAYVACGGTETEAIDYIVCKKVLRKLESVNPILVREEADGLIALIGQLFGEESMGESIQYLERLKRLG